MDHLCALVATARDLQRDERCIANPVWVVPVRAEVALLERGARSPGVAFPAGTLQVVFRFPISMSAEAGTRAFLRPLDSRGNSTDPEIELVASPGWEAEDGVSTARYSVVNAADVPDPPEPWDADSHRSVAGIRSFVVYLQAPADVHGNRLNDVGRAFAYPTQEAPR
jgi:hypothetical protein